jgi:hypothetical protein
VEYTKELALVHKLRGLPWKIRYVPKSFNIINKESNDYIKLSNSIEGKKVNLMKRIEYIDIIETIAIFFVVYIHNYTIIGTTSMANITLQFSSIISVPLFYMCNELFFFLEN